MAPDSTVPQPEPAYKVMALYKFAALPDAGQLQPELARFCRRSGIGGTLILAPEGINGTVAGRPEAIAALADYLFMSGPFGRRLAGAEVKYASADSAPFLRLKVRLKPEIVTLRAPEANPTREVGTYVDPLAWNGLIGRDDVLVVDTRNAYEVSLGSFEGAIDPGTDSFVAFKDFVAEKLDPARHKKIAMFCTGGIRCEKASSYLLNQGFAEVFHLQGGILNYLEKVPAAESRFAGECFVFDGRVSVGPGLAPGTATLCHACRHPLTPADRQHPDYVDAIACPYCAGQTDKHRAAAERQRQMELARRRGTAHLGDAAIAAARQSRADKTERAARSRRGLIVKDQDADASAFSNAQAPRRLDFIRPR